MIYAILICIIVILTIAVVVQYFAVQVSTAIIVEFEKWANRYGYTFLDVDRSIKYPDTVNNINSVIEEIEDIVKNGYDGNGDK